MRVCAMAYIFVLFCFVFGFVSEASRLAWCGSQRKVCLPTSKETCEIREAF